MTPNDDNAIATLAEALVGELIEAELTVATAESCTGGWIAKSLTDIAGSSDAFGYGFVSYSNAAKGDMLGVSAQTLEQAGAVSEPAVREMAAGAIAASGADLAVAVSGIAGPTGGSADKPVGTVWFAWAERGGDDPVIRVEVRRFDGERDKVRAQTVILALQGLREITRERG
jgi:nicotinamide-nucleotide amidase